MMPESIVDAAQHKMQCSLALQGTDHLGSFHQVKNPMELFSSYRNIVSRSDHQSKSKSPFIFSPTEFHDESDQRSNELVQSFPEART